jgi:LacI family transcriptional regulator
MSQIPPKPVPRPARPTMRDVAALAGVAIKTVSRVMNEVPTVDPELVSRVRKAADMLGYRPNLTASSLRRGAGRTATIGLLLEDVANPFSAGLLRAVEDEARDRGVQVLIGSLDQDPHRERALARTLIDRQVDGLILVPAHQDQSYLLAEKRLGVCVVFLDREPRLFIGDAVVSDNRGGAITAVEHLLARGHRRIGYLGDSLSIATAVQRFEGYERALELGGTASNPRLIEHGLRAVDDAEKATTRMLEQADPPTALFTSQNLVTIGATKALHRLGLQGDVALVGFDDFALADVLQPGVTVIAQDTAGLGRQAAQLLFRRLSGDDSPPRTRVLPTELVPRGSGEIGPPSPGLGMAGHQ